MFLNFSEGADGLVGDNKNLVFLEVALMLFDLNMLFKFWS